MNRYLVYFTAVCVSNEVTQEETSHSLFMSIRAPGYSVAYRSATIEGFRHTPAAIGVVITGIRRL